MIDDPEGEIVLRLQEDEKKYNFIQDNFKRGGISHCDKPGKYTCGVASVDVTSQYPSACMYGRVLIGMASWVSVYKEAYHGFYELTNLKFNKDYALKPACQKEADDILNWKTGKSIDHIFLDSYTIKYLKEHYGLESFDVIIGLCSAEDVPISNYFGTFVNTLFSLKREQDVLNDTKDVTYNPSYRTYIKLCLTTPTGRAVMDKNKFTSLVSPFMAKEYAKCTSHQTIGGKKFGVPSTIFRCNYLLRIGVMIYSYSIRHSCPSSIRRQ